MHNPVDIINKNVIGSCEICAQSSMTKNTSKIPRSNRGSYYGEFIHSDICGPISPMTNTKKRYILTFIDDYSKCTEIYLLNKRKARYIH